MNKNRFVAMVAALVLLAVALTGCANSSSAPFDVLAEVDGTKVYRWYYDLYHDQQIAMYMQYMGKDYTAKENAAEYKELKVRFLEDIIERAATLNKAVAEGYGELTDAEKDEIAKGLAESYEESVSSFMAKYQGDADARAKAEADYQEGLTKKHLTKELLEQDAYENFVITKFMREYGDMKEITEEELSSYYNELLQQQQKDAQDGVDYLGETKYTLKLFYPEGYIFAKLLVLPYSAVDQTTVSLNEEAVNSATGELLAAISQNGADSKQAKSAQTALEKALTAYNNALEIASKNIQKVAAEAAQRVKNGEALEAVYESLRPNAVIYGQYLKEGSQVVAKEIVDAALAIENVNGVSELVESADGCAFVQLVENVQSRTIPLDEIREDMIKEIEMNKYYSTQYALKLQCVAEAKSIIRHQDKL